MSILIIFVISTKTKTQDNWFNNYYLEKILITNCIHQFK
jgi:hypothetical protein